MKYLIVWHTKDPFKENLAKALAIQRKRVEKGEDLGEAIVFPIHSFVTENKACMIVETEDYSNIAKWAAAYSSVFKWKVIPLVEWSSVQEYFTG